ncbi:MAG: hypothetical protein MI739_01120 [Bacteroidales bacterium]|nr:hypothetical protein [Bacteroidales bacterium]
MQKTHLDHLKSMFREERSKISTLSKLQSTFREERSRINTLSKKTKDEIEAEQLEQDKNQDRKERKKYASHTFWFVIVYVVVILLLVIATGLNYLKISDKILLALIVTSFAEIIGLFVFVMKYLFKV